MIIVRMRTNKSTFKEAQEAQGYKQSRVCLLQLDVQA